MTPTLREVLSATVGDANVLMRPIDLAAFASDASVYRIVPTAVVRPRSVEDVQALFALARRERVPLAFRAAGTSLSGQAVTAGLLADVSRHWRLIEVLDGGRRVRVQPGAVGAAVNARLRASAAKIGPDPASIHACMMGGILANNSSGMCCGVAQNAYHTLDSLVVVLPSGTVVDTAKPDADEALRAAEPALYDGLLALKRDIAARPVLDARIRRKYLTKNTTGYSLNAFIDYERPADILAHLVIGSEGTLGFIAEAVLRTVPDLPVKYTGLLLFPALRVACDGIVPLRDAGAAAVEIMDRAALRSVERQPGVPSAIAGLPEGAAGLLVEFQAGTDTRPSELEERAASGTAGLSLLVAARFTHDADEQASLWRIRQGMFPSVGAARRRGTTVLIEDVAFPVERLAEAVGDLRRIFAKHRYDDAIVFGHAKDGNLHFVISQSFNDDASVGQYARMMDDVVGLVVGRYDGALKAEHGTGRNIAPFVETEWGADAYAIMRRVKALADPDSVLNPGVLISDDPKAHLAHLKTLPSVDDAVDQCIECGYCEARCPSRDLTLTPRQRIVVRRQMERLRSRGDATGDLEALAADFEFDGLDTCAADGLCATACPVAIDTGTMVRHLRTTHHLPLAHRAAVWAARHFATVEGAVRLGLRVGGLGERVLGGRAVTALSRLPGLVLRRRTPIWMAPMPRAASRAMPATDRVGAVAVYFPSCVSRTMGSLPSEPAGPSLVQTFVDVAARAGRPVWIPAGTDGHCCGVPFSSKGYVRAHRMAVNRTIDRLWAWSDGGRLPVVVDTSPCSHGLRSCREALTGENQTRFDALAIVDSVEFAARTLLPALTVRRRRARVVVHPVCAVVKMNLSADLERIASRCADEVVWPEDAGCCGFAGDRGWLVPELTMSATRREAETVAGTNADGHFSSSRTCEIGLTRATGRVYQSHLYLLDWATRAD
jgi:D-lactate dehydrogenase